MLGDFHLLHLLTQGGTVTVGVESVFLFDPMRSLLVVNRESPVVSRSSRGCVGVCRALAESVSMFACPIEFVVYRGDTCAGWVRVAAHRSIKGD